MHHSSAATGEAATAVPLADRYPDGAVESLDSRFDSYRVGNAAVERLWTGARWGEGPVWFGDMRCLLFSDIPNNRILRWDEVSGSVTVFRSPSNFSNGNTRDRQGRLVTCEHQSRRVTRTEHDGRITVLADNYGGKRLNAPNDVVVASDGSIWFTDPGYGIMGDYEGGKAEFELPTAIYRIDSQSGELSMVADDLDKPNGLCFSPDEARLYAVDSGGPQDIRIFDVVGGRKLRGGGVFAKMSSGTADGIRCDVDGNVWAAVAWANPEDEGVHCIAPDGVQIGKIRLPQMCSNLCFGGPFKNRLFMTGGMALYSLYLNTRGV
jgi:gluconolactonase